MTYQLRNDEIAHPMNREISPTAITVTLVLLVGLLGFLLWKIVLAPLDNPEPPEIRPGPTGSLAAPPTGGMPSPNR